MPKKLVTHVQQINRAKEDLWDTIFFISYIFYYDGYNYSVAIMNSANEILLFFECSGLILVTKIQTKNIVVEFQKLLV